MTGLAGMALNTAPIFGGVLLAVAAGQLKGPDYRGTIKQDLDLLDRLPPEQTARRAALQRTIEERIDDLIEADDRSREVRAAVISFRGGWRDSVLFVCAALFTFVWWNIDHQRSNWLPMFVVLIVACVATAVNALHWMWNSLARFIHRQTDGGTT